MPRGKPISADLREKIINFSEKGQSTYKIAKVLVLPRSSVQNIILRYKKEGKVDLKKKTGRPCIADMRDRRVLKTIVRENRRATASAITVNWRDKIKKDISVDTCKREIKKLGYSFYKAKKKPLLTTAQKKTRLKWAKSHKDWTIRQWKSVIWSDESKFQVCVGDERKVVIRTREEKFHKDCLSRTVKFPSSLMVWGCMSGQGVGQLCFIDGCVNAQKYQEILEEELLPSVRKLQSPEGEYIFQQDGASCHTAKSTKSWLNAHNIPLLQWPPNSPDLSPIETLWGKMKKRLKRYPAKTRQDLLSSIKEVWNSITPKECEDLVKTMPQRVMDVITSKGDATKW